MSFTVCFVQCQQKLQLPHMNMPLFVPDLRKIGCNVECFCLHAASLRRLSKLLEGRRVDLLGLEHMAPYSIIRQVKALSPATRIVVGGNGFLDLFSKTEVDFAVAGAGRESIVALVAALREGAALTGVPNLFFKQREDDSMVIRCSERFTGLSLDRELLPYAPELDWTYRGFPGPIPPLGQRGAPPTLVADLGCPCRPGTPGGRGADITLASARYPLTEAARRRLADLFAQRIAGGCSFCTYGTYAAAPSGHTVDLLVEQMKYLQAQYGFDRFCVGSEEPFRFLVPLLRRALEENITLRHLRIRSRVEWIVRFEKILREAVELSRANRFQLAVWQVGFESFCDKHLDIYAKGQSVRENVEAIRVLQDLGRQYPGWFATSVPSHGFLGSTPWTRIEDVEEQMRRIEPLPGVWRRAMLGGPVKLFDELLPFAQKVRQDGLLVRRKNGRDGFRFRDDRIRLLEEGRLHFLRWQKKLADAFFWRAALDAYWKILGDMVGELKTRPERLRDLARQSRDLRRRIDRRIQPIFNAQAQCSGGARLEARGRLPDALEAYRGARRLMPHNGTIHAALGRTAHSLGRNALARRYSRTAVRLLEEEQARHPEDPNIDILLAQCLARLGEKDKAEAHLRAGFFRRRSFIADGD